MPENKNLFRFLFRQFPKARTVIENKPKMCFRWNLILVWRNDQHFQPQRHRRTLKTDFSIVILFIISRLCTVFFQRAFLSLFSWPYGFCFHFFFLSLKCILAAVFVASFVLCGYGFRSVCMRSLHCSRF